MSKSETNNDARTGRVNRSFPAVNLGGIGMEKPALDIDTVYESFRRHGDKAKRVLGSSPDRKVDAGDENMGVRVSNDPVRGETNIEFSMELGPEIEDILAYTESVYEDRIEKLLAREQANYHAVTHYVHRVLPRRAEENESSELEILLEDLDRLGDDPNEIAEKYYSKEEGPRPSELLISWAQRFEAKPYHDKDSDFDMEMPLWKADKLDNGERNYSWLTEYLGLTTELALEVYNSEEEIEEQIRDFWLEDAAGRY